MRKIILNVAVTLDGFIEGPNGEYDWCLTDQDYGMAAFFEETDAIFIGRKSYELIKAEDYSFPGKKMYVFSDTLTPGKNEDVEVIPSTNFDHAIDGILNEAGKSIWMFGGASLLSAFIKKNLVAEVLLSVHPVILGSGKPLFGNLEQKLDLELISQQTYNTGLVQLRYSIKPRFNMDMLNLL
ncbi:dihydrofolate reductase [Mucilaginibacter terrenus]|uniref:Dihydrofolate reductase n=1 Tax=Mucilaginibacter terrenus TaxID=2482727 RepID=A0A3E2NK95_9SPHI|nr:dihydrofolate reductase family protein [Mucilaginibacter terrenus]RFZ81415.1 dihydrofolate reductase [Mucilaginibacter terrenus]